MLRWDTSIKEELMHPIFRKLFTLSVVLAVALVLSGCTIVFQKGRRSDVEEIAKLKGRLNSLEKAKAELEARLRKEISDQEVSVKMMDRGLVITFVAEVLFDSGKVELRQSSFEKLDKIADVLNTTVKDLSVGIEGHTDDVPIQRSGWRSNWELSSARALGVLHYLTQTNNISPGRLAATGYGEFRPVDDNSTPEGRQKNRRVEIVILPNRTAEGR